MYVVYKYYIAADYLGCVLRGVASSSCLSLYRSRLRTSTFSTQDIWVVYVVYKYSIAADYLGYILRGERLIEK